VRKIKNLKIKNMDAFKEMAESRDYWKNIANLSDQQITLLKQLAESWQFKAHFWYEEYNKMFSRLQQVRHECGVANLSSHIQMKAAITSSIEIADEAAMEANAIPEYQMPSSEPNDQPSVATDAK
jgi:hypothetical protein